MVAFSYFLSRFNFVFIEMLRLKSSIILPTMSNFQNSEVFHKNWARLWGVSLYLD
jgi:hypothetical protein